MNKSSLALGLLLAAMTTMPAAAEQLTPQQALERAVSSGDSHMRAPGRAMRHVYTGQNDGKATYYVYSNNASEGFCVLAADDVVADAVLGYSDNGNFDPLNIPAPLQYWLECYNIQIKDMINGVKADRSIVAPMKAAAVRHDIEPLTTTKWSQESPFNDLCPVKNNQRTYSGCVATAMAQVMKVHNWPVTGTGSNSYTPSTGVGTVAANFANSTYDWANMIDVYGTGATTAQKTAVAKLMYDCGVAVSMEYDITASGASSNAIPGALVNYFKYDKGLQELRRQYYFLDEWTGIIYDEVAAGRPVIMGGQNASGGHAFVIDGFKADGEFFHLNWGWGGMSDGYFKIMGLDPESQGIGGSTAGYNINQMITVGVKPAEADSKIVPFIGSNTGFAVKTASYTPSSSTYVQFFPGTNNTGVFSYSYATMNVEMGVKLVNQATEEVSYIGIGSEYTVKLNGGFSSYPVRSDLFPTSGTYTVTPAYKYDGEWYDVFVPINLNRSLKLVATTSRLTFSPTSQYGQGAFSNFKLNSEVYQNRPFQIAFDVQALKDEYLETAYLILLNGNSLVAMLDEFQLDVTLGEKQHITLRPYMPPTVTPGTYTLALMRQVGTVLNTLRTIQNITVVKEPNMSYKLSNIVFDGTTDKGNFYGTPAKVSLNQFKVSFDLECQDGNIADVLIGIVYDKNYNMKSTLPGEFVELNTDEKGTYTLAGDLSQSCEVDETYLFGIWGQMLLGQMMTNCKYIKGQLTTGIEMTDAVADDEIHTLLSPDGSTLAAIAASPIASVDVFAINGACVARAAGFDPQLTVDMSSLQRGIYVVRVTLANGKIVSRRIAR